MSQANVDFEMSNGKFPVPPTSGEPIRVINVADATYGSVAVLIVAGRAISLAATGTGYAEGCIGIDTTGVSGANSDSAFVKNTGSSASPTWTIVT